MNNHLQILTARNLGSGTERAILLTPDLYWQGVGTSDPTTPGRFEVAPVVFGKRLQRQRLGTTDDERVADSNVRDIAIPWCEPSPNRQSS